MNCVRGCSSPSSPLSLPPAFLSLRRSFPRFFDQTRGQGHLYFSGRRLCRPADAFDLRRGGACLAGHYLSTLAIHAAAGLKENERKYIRFFAPASLILFVAGCVFGYWVIIPVGMKFLLSFSTESIIPMITLPNYISFIVTLVLAFGLCFQLPLVLMFLAKIGIVTPAFLVQKRKHAIVLILIASAILTPLAGRDLANADGRAVTGAL